LANVIRSRTPSRIVRFSDLRKRPPGMGKRIRRKARLPRELEPLPLTVACCRLLVRLEGKLDGTSVLRNPLQAHGPAPVRKRVGPGRSGSERLGSRRSRRQRLGTAPCKRKDRRRQERVGPRPFRSIGLRLPFTEPAARAAQGASASGLGSPVEQSAQTPPRWM
jgi:hypothetical protein